MMNSTSFWLSTLPLLVVNAYVLSALVLFFFISKNRPKTTEVEDRHSSVILNKWIREYWMWLTNPIYTFFIAIKITPNMISMLGTFVALLSAISIALGFLGLGGWLMVLGASLDFFDGRVARATNQETLAGSFLDSSLDRISEGLVVSGIAYYYLNSHFFWVAMLAYLGSMLTSYTKAKGESMGVNYSGGMMQRPERLAYLGAGGILTPMIAFFLFPLFTEKFPNLTLSLLESYLYAVPLTIVAIFCNTASFNRIVNIMRLLNAKEGR